MEARIEHYLSTQHALTSTDRLILLLINDAGDGGTTAPRLAGLCGTSWEYTQARIYLMKRAGILRRVSNRHYALSQPTATVSAAASQAASGSEPLSSGKGEIL